MNARFFSLFAMSLFFASAVCAAEGEDPAKSPVTTVLAGKSRDGKRFAVLVSDYRMRRRRLVIDVRGVAPDAKVTAHVHDQTHDFAPTLATFADGRLTLEKSDAESAAFLVEFEAPSAGPRAERQVILENRR